MATEQKQIVILKSFFAKHTWISISHIPGNCTKRQCFGLLCLKCFLRQLFYLKYIFMELEYMSLLTAQDPLMTTMSTEMWRLSLKPLSYSFFPSSEQEQWYSPSINTWAFCLLSLTLVLRSDVQMYSAMWYQTARNCIQMNFSSKPTCAQSKQIHQYQFLSEQQTGIIYTSKCNAHNNNKLTMQIITLCTHINSFHKQSICHTNLEFFNFNWPVTSH